MKPREPRRKVLIRARMRVGANWCDACILNISSRGMLLQAARPPLRGSYVEIRRGAHIIVARVVWERQHRFGVRAQDLIFIDSIVVDPDTDDTQRPIAHQTPDRRDAPRSKGSADRSRVIGRAVEFACLGCLAAAGATTLYGITHEALAKPLSTITRAFGN